MALCLLSILKMPYLLNNNKISNQIKQRCDASQPNAIMSQEEKIALMGSPKKVLPLNEK